MANIASARSANAVTRLRSTTAGRRRCTPRYRYAASPYRAVPPNASAISGPRASSGGNGSSSGGHPARDTSAHATIAAVRHAVSAQRRRIRRAAAVGDHSMPDASARRPPTHRPTGVANTKPELGCSRRTPGVARVCNPRNPAAIRKAHATSNSRGSERRPAAAAISTPSTTLSTAVPRTSPKWAGWFSQRRSSWGRAIRSHRTRAGSAMWNVHAATRTHAPDRVPPVTPCTTAADLLRVKVRPGTYPRQGRSACARPGGHRRDPAIAPSLRPPLEPAAVGCQQLVEPALGAQHLVEVDQVVVGERWADRPGLDELGWDRPELEAHAGGDQQVDRGPVGRAHDRVEAVGTAEHVRAGLVGLAQPDDEVARAQLDVTAVAARGSDQGRHLSVSPCSLPPQEGANQTS